MIQAKTLAKILWPVAAVVVLMGAYAPDVIPRKKLGVRIKIKDAAASNQADLGQGVFFMKWVPDPGTYFNEVACARCHDTPAGGGINKNPVREVRVVPDDKDISGFVNYRRTYRDEDFKEHRREYPANAEPRKTPSLFGLGMLDAVPVNDFVALTDPTDKNGDGISGRLYKINGKYGLYGWKSNVPTLEEFIVTAFDTEMGILPYDSKTHPNGSLDIGQIKSAYTYLRILEAPTQAADIKEFEPGRRLFADIGCASCHTPTLKTGACDIEELSHQEFHPYTDLLLHEMRDGDLVSEAPKPGLTEFRTPPLWGVGQIGGPFMHDTSAKTITEAIMKHGGEAAKSRAAFEKLSDSDKKALLDFIDRI